MLRTAAPLLFGVRRAAAARPPPLFAHLPVRRPQLLVLRFSTPSSSSSTSSAAAATAAEKPLTHVGRLKDLWRKYGVVAIGTYLGMYGAVLGSIYAAIDLGWVSTARPPRDDEKDADDGDFNLVAATNKFVTLAEELGIAKYLEVEHVNSRTGTFLLAWIATKFTEPVRLAVTLAITPRIARFFGRVPQIKPKARKP